MNVECKYIFMYLYDDIREYRERGISVCAEKTRERFLREEGNATLYHVLHAYTDTYLHIRTLKKQKAKRKKKITKKEKRNKSGTWWNSTCKFYFSRVVLE